MPLRSDFSIKTTLADVVSAHADKKPSGVAFIDDNRTMTWSQYDEWSTKLACLFVQMGIQKGENLAILLPDCLETHVTYLACEKSGVVGAAISARAGLKEIEHLINVSRSKVVISKPAYRDWEFNELFSHLLEVCPSLKDQLVLSVNLDFNYVLTTDGQRITTSSTDAVTLDMLELRKSAATETFLLNTTSGTTGMPKCVKQHQRRWFEFAELVTQTADISEADIFLRAIPASVGFGLWSGHFVPTLLGSTTVILSKFNVKDLLEAIQRHRVTILSAVSTQWIMMLSDDSFNQYDLKSLRLMYTGGEAIPYDRAIRFEQATAATILQFYGSNETGALSYTSVEDSQENRLTTAGRVIPNMNVKLIDESENYVTDRNQGQPVCRGPLTSHGYFNDEDANRDLFTRDGFMKMEDVVTLDSLGYIRVIGRIGDFIIRGGKNISAVTVEEAILGHPQVVMAAAVAMPDPVFGEKVCAYVVQAPGAELTLPDLVKFLSTQGVSKEYFPEKLILVDELPTVSGGKIAKQVLREDIRQRLANAAEGDIGGTPRATA